MQAEEKKVTKLQIGVKKRVEDCDVRSKKGLWGGGLASQLALKHMTCCFKEIQLPT